MSYVVKIIKNCKLFLGIKSHCHPVKELTLTTKKTILLLNQVSSFQDDKETLFDLIDDF